MERVPDGFRSAARTAACPNAAIADESPGLLRRAVPPRGEPHRDYGTRDAAELPVRAPAAPPAAGPWAATAPRPVEADPPPRRSHGRVLLALSGGVDTSVAAALLSEAVGDRLTAVFVDHGLLSAAARPTRWSASSPAGSSTSCAWTPATASSCKSRRRGPSRSASGA